MKEYTDNSRFNKNKQPKKLRDTLQRRMNLFFLICICFAVMVLVIGVYINSYPFAADKQLSTLPTIGTSNNNSIGSGENSVDETEWCLILVNKWNYIPSDYDVEFTELANGELVDKRIYAALQEMFVSARNDGIYPIVASGYRTAEKQQRLMDEKIAAYKSEGYSAEEATAKAEAWVAIPGTSEHQLGIAVDINADGIYSTGEEVYRWLNQNGYRFGFICRYPDNKTEITGVINEPWHYRYVGVRAAVVIRNQGICLEEYLNRIN